MERKEYLESVLEKEISEVKELDKSGDRQQFINRLYNLKDYVSESNTEEELDKVYSENVIQDILREYKNK